MDFESKRVEDVFAIKLIKMVTLKEDFKMSPLNIGIVGKRKALAGCKQSS